MASKFIVVAGNIGVGKSSLTKLLCERLGWEPLFESQEENPYLADFYQDMKRYSFQSQVFFLTHRFRDYQQIIRSANCVIHDRSIYEDADIFVTSLYRQGSMDERDYRTYRQLLEAMLQFLPVPDLLVYLRASTATLLHRIKLRGRSYEMDISPDYIEQLNQRYEEWIADFSICPVLTIDTDTMDFVASAGRSTYTNQIELPIDVIVEGRESFDYIKAMIIKHLYSTTGTYALDDLIDGTATTPNESPFQPWPVKTESPGVKPAKKRNRAKSKQISLPTPSVPVS